jgi:large subunit ribosomal protein L6
MSRVAKNPVSVPKGVEITIENQQISIKSQKGCLVHKIHKSVAVTQETDQLIFSPREKSQVADALAGTTRAIVSNYVQGVTQGFEKKLTLVGVGYRAEARGKVLGLTLGFSHPVNFDVPEGVVIETPTQTEIIIKGIDKQLVGQVAANIRRFRPPEPYKGKGVRYANEVILLKEAKKK